MSANTADGAAVRRLVLGADEGRTVAALVEDGRVMELWTENARGGLGVGNIYLAKVLNRVESINAVFADIGTGKNALMSGDDLPRDASGRAYLPRGEVLAQVDKLPVGDKGALLSANIKLAGTMLVLRPLSPGVGVSGRIADERERARLKEAACAVCPKGMGLIVRTGAEGASLDELNAHLNELLQRWESIRRRAEHLRAPALLWDESDLCCRLARDVPGMQLSEVMCGSEEVRLRMAQALEAQGVCDVKLSLHTSDIDLLTVFGVRAAMREAQARRVNLKSGGFLIFDRTEALTVIDVNSGAYTPKLDAGEAALKLNREAAREIARQLRLRGTGGIIIIDFIDMPRKAQQDELTAYLTECLRSDRAHTHVYGLTRLGLMEMSRQKRNEETGR